MMLSQKTCLCERMKLIRAEEHFQRVILSSVGKTGDFFAFRAGIRRRENMKKKNQIRRILSLVLALGLILPQALLPLTAKATEEILTGELGEEEVLVGTADSFPEEIPMEEFPEPVYAGAEVPALTEVGTRVPNLRDGTGHVISIERYQDGVGSYILRPVLIDFAGQGKAGAIRKALHDCGVDDLEIVDATVEPGMVYIESIGDLVSDPAAPGDYINDPVLADRTWMAMFNSRRDPWDYMNWNIQPENGVELGATHGVLRVIYTEQGGNDAGQYQDNTLTVSKDTLLTLIAQARMRHPDLVNDIASAEQVALDPNADMQTVYAVSESLQTAMAEDPNPNPAPESGEPDVPHIERIKIDGPYRRSARGGERIQFTCTKTPADAVEEVWWEVDYADLASIDTQSGEFTALRGGTVTVVAHCGWALPQTCVVTITNPAQAVEIMAGDQHTDTVEVVHGKTLQLKAVTTPDGTSDPITWSSDNEAVASVDQKGLVTTDQPGTATIRVDVGSVHDEITVHVINIPATGVSLSEAEVSMKESGVVTVQATVSPEKCTDELLWTVDDPWIAEVRDGAIKGLHPGETVVTATAGDFSASVKVTVLEGAVIYFEYADGRPAQKIDTSNDSFTLSTIDVGRFRIANTPGGYWFDNTTQVVDPEGYYGDEYIVREDGTYNPYDQRTVNVTAVFEDFTAKDFKIHVTSSGITELRVRIDGQLVDNEVHASGRTGNQKQIIVEGRRSPDEEFFVVPHQALTYLSTTSTGIRSTVTPDGVVTLRSGVSGITALMQENYDVQKEFMVDALPWQVNTVESLQHGVENLSAQRKSQLGDEPIIFALCRAGSGVTVEERDSYLNSVWEAFSQRAVLTHADYAKIIMTMTVLGQDPESFEGVNLLERLCAVTPESADMAAWTLLALDSYQYPVNGPFTREDLLNTVFAAQNPDGSFGDVTSTALAMQALAPYRSRSDAGAAYENGRKWLNTQLTESAGFHDGFDENSRILSQVILAVCEAGLDPLNPTHGFTCRGEDMVSHAMEFSMPSGFAKHETGREGDVESTWQVVLALESYNRLLHGRRRIFDLRDVEVNIPQQTNQERADVVIQQIAALPDPAGLGDQEAVNAARKAFDALTVAQQNLVTNYEKLQSAEQQIQAAKEAEKAEADRKAAKAVEDQIAQLKVTSLDDRIAVQAVRANYNRLTQAQKNLVSNYDLLTAAEEQIRNLTQQTAEEKDRAAAREVDNKIQALHVQSVKDQEAVEAARAAYDGLTVDQKKYVTKLGKLISAERLLAEMIKYDTDQKAAQEMNEILDNLKVESLADKPAVEAARAHYETLTQDQKNRVADRGRLDAAERKIKELEKLEVDTAEAKIIEDRIAALDVKSLADGEEVHATRMAYKSLTAAQRRLVTNEHLLVEAEQKIADLQAQADKEAADKAAAKLVAEEIEALNPQTHSDRPAVEAARTHYEALTEEQKAFVPNLEKLTAAEKRIQEIEAAAAQAEADKKAAKDVEDQINKLKAETLADKPAVEGVRKAFDALTDAQKKLVHNEQKLKEAEQKIRDLESAAAQAEADKKAAKAVEDQIDQLKAETLADKPVVEAARKAFDSLTDNQKKLVPNEQKLKDAEKKIRDLESAAAQAEADKKAAKAVEDKIAALKPTQDLAKDKASAAEARKAYKALTPAQKKLVPNVAALEKFEQDLKDREKPTENSDETAAKAVEEQIAAIELPITLEDKTQIREARRAYDALTPAQKKLVSNISRLEAAEGKLQELEKEPTTSPTTEPATRPTTEPGTRPTSEPTARPTAAPTPTTSGGEKGGKGPVKTGDEMPLGMLLTAVFLSAGALMMVPAWKRKE